MSTLKIFLRDTATVLCMLLSVSCSARNSNADIILTGSTPGDEPVKSMLTIPAETKVDFIRWNLILGEKNSFVLDIHYGESQPNTLGFKKDGEKKTIKGTFTISEGSNFKEVYHLKSHDLYNEILVAKINENIFHLLTPQQKMMVGNGGWSYSLNRKETLPENGISISTLNTDMKSLKLVYDGRTPCREMANEHPEMGAASSCFKIKWRLILYRDSVTHQPTTCTIRNIVNNEPRDISGKWEMINGTEKNPGAIIYKITVSNLADPILFFAGDDNILFFLDKDMEPMIGNKDFSYTMNRIRQ